MTNSCKKKIVFFTFFHFFLISLKDANVLYAQVKGPSFLGQKVSKKILGSESSEIAVKVNGDVITYRDIHNRVSLVLMSLGNSNAVSKNEIFNQVKSSLIQETLQKQICKRLKIAVSSLEITEAFKSIAKDNSMSVEDMKKMFESKNIPIQTLKQRLEAQIGWSKVAQSVFGYQVHITEKESKDILERIEGKQSQTLYEVSEVVIYVNNEEQKKRAFSDMRNIEEAVDKGVDIKILAQQFSQSISSSKGGYVGWIGENQCSSTELESLKSLEIGGCTKPIRFNGGYRVLYLHDIQKRNQAPHKETKITYQTVTIPIKDISNSEKELIAYRMEELKNKFLNCGEFEKVMKKWGYQVNKPLPTSLVDLPEIWEKTFKTAKIGQIVGPFNIGESLILAIVCNKKLPKERKSLTLEEVTSQIYNQKLEKIITREFNRAMSIAFIEDLTLKNNKKTKN